MIETTAHPVLRASRREVPSRFAGATALRVFYSLVLFEDVAHLYVHRDLFRDTGAWPQFPIGSVCLVWLAALGLLTFGVRTGAAALVNWLCCVVMLGIAAPNEGFQQAACDSVIIGVAFLLIILPRLSPATGRWMLAAYLIAIYLDSGVHKLLSPMWSGGFGVAAPMSFPSLVWVPMNWMSWLPSWIWHGMGYGVVAFELLFGVLYAWHRTRVPALIVGILMHAGIAIVYPIPVFGWIMVSICAGLLPERWYRPMERFVHTGVQDPVFLSPQMITGIAMGYALSVAAVYTPAYLPAKAAHKAGWLIAGVASHEVFAEYPFSHYNYQVRLVGNDGMITPYSRGNLLDRGVRDRVWELWWKRSDAPNVAIQDASVHLLAWARFYCGDPVRIEGRRQQAVTRAIDAGLFHKNNAIPWSQIGNIQSGRVRWQIPPSSGKENVGDYMQRILP